jgi:hypothetical protein
LNKQKMRSFTEAQFFVACGYYKIILFYYSML